MHLTLCRGATLPLALALAFASPSFATGQAYGTPEAVAAAVLQADSVHDWHLLLALAHPDALLEFRHNQLQILNPEPFPPGFPGMDSCTLKHIAAWHRYILDSVFRVPNVDSLSHMRPESVFARSERMRPRPLHRSTVIDSGFAPVRAILGHVSADDSTIYVVIEDRYPKRPMPDWPLRRPQIMTLRRYRGDWRSMLDPDLGEGFGGALMMSEDDCK